MNQLEARLLVWRAQIDELVGRAVKSGPATGIDVLQRIDELKVRCALTQARLDKMSRVPPG